ncbi:MAG: NAD-dependent epimerase/dehydratase family protein [Planctomycetota bacterium]
MTPPRALVTGGAGFIGSHLVEHLLADGVAVTVIDDLSTGQRANLAGAAAGPHADRLEFTEASLGDALSTFEDGLPFDEVYHLAAAVGVQRVVDQPVQSIENNIAPTSALLAMAARTRPQPRVFIASSSEVYGKSTELPFREDGDCVFGPTTAMRWSYAASKAIDEYLALAHHAADGLPAVVGRFFNTVGPRQVGRYGMVLPRFVAAALGGEPLRIFGDGHQTRCFCDVRDVVPAVVSLLRHPGAAGGVCNIGSDQEITIRDLAQLVIKTLGSHSDMTLVPYIDAYGPGFEDPPARRPDLTKLRSLIDFPAGRDLTRTIADLAESLRPAEPAAES